MGDIQVCWHLKRFLEPGVLGLLDLCGIPMTDLVGRYEYVMILGPFQVIVRLYRDFPDLCLNASSTDRI